MFFFVFESKKKLQEQVLQILQGLKLCVLKKDNTPHCLKKYTSEC